MASKPSEGPWRVEALDDRNIWVMDEDNNYIAEVVVEDDVDNYIRRASTRHANAHMLAASPDLTLAAKAAICLLKRIIKQSGTPEHMHEAKFALTMLTEAVYSATRDRKYHVR